MQLVIWLGHCIALPWQIVLMMVEVLITIQNNKETETSQLPIDQVVLRGTKLYYSIVFLEYNRAPLHPSNSHLLLRELIVPLWYVLSEQLDICVATVD